MQYRRPVPPCRFTPSLIFSCAVVRFRSVDDRLMLMLSKGSQRRKGDKGGTHVTSRHSFQGWHTRHLASFFPTPRVNAHQVRAQWSECR